MSCILEHHFTVPSTARGTWSHLSLGSFGIKGKLDWFSPIATEVQYTSITSLLWHLPFSKIMLVLCPLSSFSTCGFIPFKTFLCYNFTGVLEGSLESYCFIYKAATLYSLQLIVFFNHLGHWEGKPKYTQISVYKYFSEAKLKMVSTESSCPHPYLLINHLGDIISSWLVPQVCASRNLIFWWLRNCSVLWQLANTNPKNSQRTSLFKRIMILEEEMATHSSSLAWRIPWTGEPGRLQSMGSQRAGHDLATTQIQKTN